ncbi:hypothetical protein EDD99_4052 [Streptomyces sp. 846.5]|nr:hypothetical protein [Streptomyces sp. 846.5]TDU05534.1 hypothetical protein EDD99_4052 [Streptomyces sp. 846.5]
MSTISSGDGGGPVPGADRGRDAPADGTGSSGTSGAGTGAAWTGGAPGPEPWPGGARPGPEPRARVRVVRPGGGSAGAPPMPVAPPTALPPWLDPATAAGPPAAGSGPGSSYSETGGRYPAGPRGDAFDPDPYLAPDEREIRELLHRAVGGLQPAPGALEQLRRAVPQRRQRRRRIYGSAALTAALCLIGGLALHSAAGEVLSVSGPQTTRSYGDAANNHSASGGAGISSSPSYSPLLPYPSLDSGGALGGAGTSGGGSTNAVSPVPGSPGSGRLQPSGLSSGQGGTAARYTTPSPGAPIVPTTSAVTGSSSVANSASTAPAAAECVQSQLGAGSATVAAADSAGIVYGTFLVTNVSAKTCVVSQPGTVAVLSVNGSDPSWITITQHTVGDPAGGLPTPAATPAPVVLAPGKAYAVGFAWVPTTGTGAPSCVTTSPSASASTAGSGGTSAALSTQSQSNETSSTTGQPSVVLGHTPGAGGSAVSAVVPNACGGTVYRTAPLATVG